MRFKKATALLLATGMTFPACSGSDTEVTTAAPTTASTEPPTTATVAPSTTANQATTTVQDDPSPESLVGPYDGTEIAVHECLVSSDLLWTDSEAVAQAVIGMIVAAGLGDAGILTEPALESRAGLAGLYPADVTATILEPPGGWRFVDLSKSSVTPMQLLGIVSEANSDLGSSGVVAPVYGMVFEIHWGLEPGEEAYVAVDNVPTGEPLQGEGATVAIVDSGFPGALHDAEGVVVVQDLATLWPDLGLDVGLDKLDKADFIPSHGAFVTSLIRQLAPAATIYGTKGGRSSEKYVDNGEAFEPTLITDGLAVISALGRLRNATDSASPLVVNLSLGTYSCPADLHIPPPQSVGAYLLGWLLEAEQQGQVLRIVAAGGNESLESDEDEGVFDTAFYPAAYDFVDGIAALEYDNEMVVWRDGVRVYQTASGWAPADRSWVKQASAKIGVGVVGVGDVSPGYWSGSSFAAAIASGMLAAGIDIDDPDQWCPSPIAYFDTIDGVDGVCAS